MKGRILMENNIMDEPRKGKRKTDNSEKKKAKKLVLVDEAEAKKVKKQPAAEVQSAIAKTIQSKSSKRSFIEVKEAQTRNVRSPPSRKPKKFKESISSSNESSSDNEEQPKKRSKTVKNPIQDSSDSESTSDNEEQPQSFRKIKLNKHPIPVKNSSDSESTSNDQDEGKMFKGLKDSIYIQNSDSESSSDDEEETQRLSKENIIKEFKEPIHIQNSSDSDSASDDEEEAQRFSKKRMIEKFKDPIHIQNSISSKSMSGKKEQEILQDECCETRKKDNDSDIMSKEDQLILIKRIQEYIPDDDHRSYHYRLKQLEWHKVAFKDYTIDQCKQIWSQLFKKVRHYRLLQEITSDIQEILKFNDLQAINMNPIKKRVDKHPAMPDRPLSSYFIYYTKNCDKLAKKRPDLQGISFEKYIIEKYRQLSSEEKQKYDSMATEMRKDYEVKLAQFYDEHPYVKKEKQVYKKNIKVLTEKPPQEPQKSFGLFLASEMKNQTPEDRTQFRKDCREKWKQLPDLVKLDWINQAEEGIIEYQKKLGEYMARHPKYIPKKSGSKTGLTTEERRLKEKLSGKPKKPPLTPFHLFTSTIIPSSAETVLAKERWKYCSVKWKALPQEDKDQYFQLLKKKHRRYERDFNKYLDTLPEDKRQEEIVQASKKRQPKL